MLGVVGFSPYEADYRILSILCLKDPMSIDKTEQNKRSARQPVSLTVRCVLPALASRRINFNLLFQQKPEQWNDTKRGVGCL